MDYVEQREYTQSYRPPYGLSLEAAAAAAIDFYREDCELVARLELPPQVYAFNFHSIVLPLNGESTAEGFISLIRAIHKERAELYATAPVPGDARKQVQGGSTGDMLEEAVVSAVQCAQNWGNGIFRREPTRIAKLRHVFEWHGVAIPFNPWAEGEPERLAEAVIQAMEVAREAYLNSAEHKEKVARRLAEVAELQAKLPAVMAELPEKLKGSMTDLIYWVVEFCTYHNRVGVVTDPDAVVSLFREQGFRPGDFAGPDYRRTRRASKDKMGRFVIGKFLEVLPLRCGIPSMFEDIVEKFLVMPDEVTA